MRAETLEEIPHIRSPSSIDPVQLSCGHDLDGLLVLLCHLRRPILALPVFSFSALVPASSWHVYALYMYPCLVVVEYSLEAASADHSLVSLCLTAPPGR